MTRKLVYSVFDNCSVFVFLIVFFNHLVSHVTFTDLCYICVGVYIFISSAENADSSCLHRTAVFKTNVGSGSRIFFVDLDEWLSSIDRNVVIEWTKFVLNKMLAQKKMTTKPGWTEPGKPFKVGGLNIIVYRTIGTVLQGSDELFAPE